MQRYSYAARAAHTDSSREHPITNEQHDRSIAGDDNTMLMTLPLTPTDTRRDELQMEKDDTQQYEGENITRNPERIDDTVNTTLLHARPGEDVETPAEDATTVPTT
jgi:hypothetical protein